MKAVEPMGRFRKKITYETPAEAEELADPADKREETLFNRFMSNLSGTATAAHFVTDEAAPAPGVEIDRSVLPAAASDTSSYEKAMMVMAEVRDDLISRFSSIGEDRAAYALFTTAIHKIEGGMHELGMEIEPFNPLTSMSGLSSNEELLANAKEVVANTVKRYTIHKIADIRAEIHRGSPSVAISIEVEDSGSWFLASGRIVAPEDFSGNEAVDFVAKEGQCALSVKALSLGRFQDVSDRFSIDFDVSPLESPSKNASPPPSPQ